MNRLIIVVGVFIAIGLSLAIALIIIFRGGQPSGPTYYALFRDASGLKIGSDVRVAGVAIGRVEAVSVLRDNTAKVAFTAQDGFPINQASEATVKYKNVIGDRYLALTPGSAVTLPLAPGGVLPVTQTHPALSLDALFNGFAPLYQGLQPDQVNELSSSIIRIFQGEGGSIDGLLEEISGLTRTLADKDEVIGQLISNLNGVLSTVNDHSSQLDSSLSQLARLVSGLSNDRKVIGDSISGVNDAAESIGDLLKDGRPDIRDSVHELDRLSTALDSDRSKVDSTLRKLPGYYQVLGRIGGQSAAVQFYLCGVQARIALGGQTVLSPMIQSEVPRCHF